METTEQSSRESKEITSIVVPTSLAIRYAIRTHTNVLMILSRYM